MTSQPIATYPAINQTPRCLTPDFQSRHFLWALSHRDAKTKTRGSAAKANWIGMPLPKRGQSKRIPEHRNYLNPNWWRRSSGKPFTNRNSINQWQYKAESIDQPGNNLLNQTSPLEDAVLHLPRPAVNHFQPILYLRSHIRYTQQIVFTIATIYIARSI